MNKTNKVMRATIHETRKSGMEYAKTADGLLVFPAAYEWEEMVEVDVEDDAIDMSALLADVENS